MNDYWQQVGRVFSLTIVAQAIPVLATLLIARLVTPAAFGDFSVWLGMAMIASVVVTARFETALAVESDGYRRKLTLLGVVATATMFSLALCGAILMFELFDIAVLPASISRAQVILVAPAALLVALSQALQSWCAAEGWYGDLSRLRIVQAVGVSGLQLAAGLIEPSADSMALAYCAGVLTAIVFCSYLSRHLPRINLSRVVLATRYVWSKHRRFAKYSLPADSLNTAASYLPAILISGRFGSEAAGSFAMATTILGAPIGVLGKSVLDVFKRHAASAFRLRGECRAEYRQTFLVLTAGSLVTLAVAIPGLQVIVIVLLGDGWNQAANVATVLLPLFLLRFVASPLSYMVYIAGKQEWDLLWQMCLFIVISAALTVPTELNVVLLAYSVGYSLMYVIYLILSHRLSLGAVK